MRSCNSSSSGKTAPGHLPEELIFDSKLTTYRNLNRLNKQSDQLYYTPGAARPNWCTNYNPGHAVPGGMDRIGGGVSRQYKTPRILDELR